MFFLFQLHFHFLHLFTDALIWGHLTGLEEHFAAKHEEQSGCQEVGDGFGDEGGHGVAQQGRKDGHGDESGEGGSENEHSVMAHRHERRDEEGLVANFREEDHGEGEEEGVHGLDHCTCFSVRGWRRGFGASVG